MPITKVIPEIWSARLLRAFERATVWNGLVTDVSSELAAGGDTLHLGKITSAVTVRDYAREAAIAAPEFPTDAEETLVLAQKKYFNLGVDDLDRVQAKPALLDEFSRMAAVEVGKGIDTHIYTIVRAGIAAARKTSVTKLRPVVNATTANRQAFALEILDAVEEMDNANWPADGRWAVIPTDIKKQLVIWLIEKNLLAANTTDEAIKNAAFSRIFGLDIRADSQITRASATGNPYAILGMRTATIYVSQVQKVEAYRHPSYFADALKGLYLYQAKVVDTVPLLELRQAA